MIEYNHMKPANLLSVERLLTRYNYIGVIIEKKFVLAYTMILSIYLGVQLH